MDPCGKIPGCVIIRGSWCPCLDNTCFRATDSGSDSRASSPASSSGSARFTGVFGPKPSWLRNIVATERSSSGSNCEGSSSTTGSP